MCKYLEDKHFKNRSGLPVSFKSSENLPVHQIVKDIEKMEGSKRKKKPSQNTEMSQ